MSKQISDHTNMKGGIHMFRDKRYSDWIWKKKKDLVKS